MPWMYIGFSVEMVRPQETAPGHAGKVMRLPFTSLRDRRKRAFVFSRPSLFCFRKDLGHGLMPPEPPARQSASACTAALSKVEKRVRAVATPELFTRPFGNVFSP